MPRPLLALRFVCAFGYGLRRAWRVAGEQTQNKFSTKGSK